ncbi:hypothetical protein H3Z83_12605 [Tenacibaculum sp. S7007]|uniref:Uncharacterized protein n=1 Tax=Tenacibaculum pelagium TaxID=2759527 RepID=A0A839ASM5_9FLAO|nr:hypothetical protein [Tenacibaculum pelagium]MBA6157350.1 hypothetical protein [Tenacibaculum pelagium]
MKKQISITCIILLVFTSCNFSQGTYKDLKTGLSYSYNGLSIEGVKILKDNTIPLQNNNIEKFSHIYFNLFGLDFLTKKEGKVSVGAEMIIKDKENNIIMDEPDLFTNNGSFEFLETVELNIYTGTNFKENKEYILTSKVWDKNNKDNSIIITFPFMVIANKAIKMPSKDEVEKLFKTSLAVFGQSVNEKNMKRFRDCTSKVWQSQHTLENFNSNYNGIINANVDLITLVNAPLTLIEHKSKITKEGFLLLNGYYPINGQGGINKIIFEQKYIIENGEWKLLGFNLMTSN